MSAREIRLLRDISRFNFWGLFIICLPTLVRGLGFDIKKFNFRKDLHELKLEKEDSEEIEVNLDIHSDNIKRSGRKIFRELKYYYIENKFFINIILIILALILVIVFPVNRRIINGDFKEGETIKTELFNIKIIESYISERNKTNPNNCYLIIKFSIKANQENYTLKLNNFVLETADNDYMPSLKYYYYFEDIGRGYRNQKLSIADYEDYILIYNINREDREKDFKLNYTIDGRQIKLDPSIWD